jgi:hypothetical protein
MNPCGGERHIALSRSAFAVSDIGRHLLSFPTGCQSIAGGPVMEMGSVPVAARDAMKLGLPRLRLGSRELNPLAGCLDSPAVLAIIAPVAPLSPASAAVEGDYSFCQLGRRRPALA